MRLSPTLIDPALPIDTQTRRKIRRAAWREWNENPAKGITFGLLAAAPLFLTMLLPSGVRNTQLGIPALALVALTYTIYIYILAQTLRRFWYAPHVYAQLRAHGYDVCPRCGYWLRDLDQAITKCPECAQPRDAIPPAQPR